MPSLRFIEKEHYIFCNAPFPSLRRIPQKFLYCRSDLKKHLTLLRRTVLQQSLHINLCRLETQKNGIHGNIGCIRKPYESCKASLFGS